MAAVAAFAMHVLEQMQRQGARAVEQLHVALLQIVNVGVTHFVDQSIERGPDFRRQQILFVERFAKFRARGHKRLVGIANQRRQNFERLSHHANSTGVLRFFGAPNKFGSDVPPVQPLPKEKPQPPRML